MDHAPPDNGGGHAFLRCSILRRTGGRRNGAGLFRKEKGEGGRRLASLATQPLVVDFLDVVTRGEKGIEFRLEEFFVPEPSTVAEHTIGELKIGERTGAIVLAIRTTEGNFDTTPSADDRLRAGDTLIVLGSRGQIERLEQLMRGMCRGASRSTPTHTVSP
ncbi:MAG TPA: TrkA C-terminal domain-containing protein [Rubrobacter sp.]|nr:TrkA C-terminal domain-containing protein [Rubrobacter sp.]